MEEDNSCCSDDTVLSVGTEEATCENLSFKSIESHLNAISQMSTALSEEATKSPPSPAMSPSSSSQSPSSPASCYRNLDFRASPSLFRRNSSPDTLCSRQNNNNNETNGTSLKFSIDNILKADFGRRITEPMNVRKARAPRKATTATADELLLTTAGKPVDLSKSESIDSKGGGSAGGAVSPTNSETASTGQQPMLWPAWVYCTRYSDRPSSGQYSLHYYYEKCHNCICIKISKGNCMEHYRQYFC